MTNTKSNLPKPSGQHNPYRPNFWGMLSNIMLAAMNKGQLLLLLFTGLIFLLLLRMPATQLPGLSMQICHTFESWHFLGWAIALFEALAWFFSSKRNRQNHNTEMNAVSFEKSELQKKLLGKNLKSSKK